MPPIPSLFCELVQVALGTRHRLSTAPTESQWRQLLSMAQEQTLEAVLSEAFPRLPQDQRPAMTSQVYVEWLGRAMVVQQRYQLLSTRSDQALAFFRSHGFACTLLKGRSLARLYPVPHHRAAGDIDVWLDAPRQQLYAFSLRTTGRISGANYQHIHYPLFSDAEVEAHVWPSFFANPFVNRRFQQWCRQHRPTPQTAEPSLDFQRVFVLVHCYRHLLGHGVGLRQLMDYYFVLKQGFSEQQRQQTLAVLHSLHMDTFCRAVMWLMQSVFGLDDSCLLTSPDEREGRFLLHEVLLTGNMGHAERRIDQREAYATPFRRFCANTRRDAFLLTHYPHEVAWSPLFSIALFVWRKAKGLQ